MPRAREPPTVDARMKPAVFEFVRARTLSEATTILLESEGAARVVAGAQSLGPMLNLRLVQPRILVDVTGIAELTEIDDRADAVTLGACITTANIEDGRRRNAGTERHRIGAIVDFRELRNAGNVHQDPRLDQTQIEHRPKRLRACHHSRSALRFKQNRGRLGQRARAYELEDGRFHSRISRWRFAR